jgi:hypothetical protein
MLWTVLLLVAAAIVFFAVVIFLNVYKGKTITGTLTAPLISTDAAIKEI